jgi:putative lipoprotein
MDGQYYELSDYGTDLVITIDGDTSTVYAEGSNTNITIETDSQPFIIEGFSVPAVEYE